MAFPLEYLSVINHRYNICLGIFVVTQKPNHKKGRDLLLVVDFLFSNLCYIYKTFLVIMSSVIRHTSLKLSLTDYQLKYSFIFTFSLVAIWKLVFKKYLKSKTIICLIKVCMVCLQLLQACGVLLVVGHLLEWFNCCHKLVKFSYIG